MNNLKQTLKGPLAWMACHHVASNLLMLAFLVGGLLCIGKIRQEVFPRYESEIVSITIAYPGASPEEVEKGVVLAIEDAISGIAGIEEVISNAREGQALISIEAATGTDMARFTQEVQKQVDRITTLPQDAEQPEVKQVANKGRVISMVLFGDTTEQVLQELGEQFRDQLLQEAGITQVELDGVKPMEITIEIDQETLRRYRLSLGDISQRIANANIDLPGGSIKTGAGQLLVRVKERRDYGSQFAKLPIITTATGSQVLLRDIAKIDDGYDESDYYAIYNGKPAVMIEVYSVGEQKPLEVSASVKSVLERIQPELPSGISVEIRRDASVDYAQRIDLLVRNSIMGLLLVFGALALFLELRLAFWVMMGIPTAFLGSFLILPALGVTLNMVSLFAFIIVLGIVVDDAIVVGEHVYHFRQQGLSPLEAAIKGAREMAMPVTFSILTNIATFIPLLFIPGEVGKIFYMVPLVVSSVFLISLIECLFVLPSHLAGLSEDKPGGFRYWINSYQQRFSHGFKQWVQHRYGPFLEWTLKHRYLMLTAAFSLLLATLAFALSGRMGMELFPKTEADYAQATLTMPFGTPVEKTEAVARKLNDAARRVVASTPNGDLLLKGVFSEIGNNLRQRNTGSHLANIRAYLAAPEIRQNIMSTEAFVQRWREEAGEIAGIESLVFESDAGGPGGGSALTIELNHRDINVLEQASRKLAEILTAYPIVKDVKNGFSAGKEQLDFTLTEEGKSLGLTAQNVARQVRNAFFGAEVLRQQRGRNELKIMVRLPPEERISVRNIEDLILRTPTGAEIPLREAVHITRGRAYTEINRRDGRRNVQIQAGVTPRSRSGEILSDLTANELPRLQAEFPGLEYSFEGAQAEMRKSLGSLKVNFLLALLAVYALLAIPFRSYLAPLIVIVSIPFGIIGAIFGHLLMGINLSILSMLGIVALSGIAVNDALVLIDRAGELELEGRKTPLQIIKAAAIQRFRPIMLTTLTTFCGLMPMIFETSRQARMLIPMAISIGFGILFATLITLILIPALYLVVNDIKTAFKNREIDGD